MSLTDLLDLAGSLLLIAAVFVLVLTYLGIAAALGSAGVLILFLSWAVGRLRAPRGDDER